MGDKQSCGQRTIMSVRGHGFRYFVAFTPGLVIGGHSNVAPGN